MNIINYVFYVLFCYFNKIKYLCKKELLSPMQNQEKRLKIVYCIPALYFAGGMERVLSMKANYFADHFDYDITIILTDGKDNPFFYPLSEKIKVVNLDIGFEELWNISFAKKVWCYLGKQRQYKKKLTKELKRIRPDITISLLRREINFITAIDDGSKKIGEIHINRAHYRNFEEHETNFIKQWFSKYWMHTLVSKLRRLDRFVVLTESDKESWKELENVAVIPNPLSFQPMKHSSSEEHRIIVVGRYCHEKGYDHLLQAWSLIQDECSDWKLEIFGEGDRRSYERMREELHISPERCVLNGRTSDIESEFVNSSFAVCSSRFEGFGLAIVEAMACGLPVVSFDCPWGPRSIITNGEDGLLVKNGDVKGLSEAMLRMINEPESRKMMSNNAKKVSQRYSIETIANKWKQLFESI